MKEKAVGVSIRKSKSLFLILNVSEKEGVSMKYSTSDEDDSKKIEIYSEK